MKSPAAILLALALFGCGSGPSPAADVGRPPAGAPADSAAVTGAVPPVETGNGQAGPIGPRLAPAPPAPQPLSPLERLVEGFRVQLFQSTSLRLAESFRDNAATELEEPVYVEYEAPLYKVRVGNFRLRSEAVTWAERLASRGFQRADVVGTLVDTGAPRPAVGE